LRRQPSLSELVAVVALYFQLWLRYRLPASLPADPRRVAIGLLVAPMVGAVIGIWLAFRAGSGGP
jgi:ABC-type nitrate/sulfonate/bicarbonate transport system permease component